jgi:hypothetical protein
MHVAVHIPYMHCTEGVPSSFPRPGPQPDKWDWASALKPRVISSATLLVHTSLAGYEQHWCDQFSTSTVFMGFCSLPTSQAPHPGDDAGATVIRMNG